MRGDGCRVDDDSGKSGVRSDGLRVSNVIQSHNHVDSRVPHLSQLNLAMKQVVCSRPGAR